MSFWNGAFAKHYDHEHPSGDGPGDFLEHGMEHGVIENYREARGTVMIDLDPITMEPLEEPIEATPIKLNINGREYVYMVPGRDPSLADLKDFLERWNRAKMPEGGRDPELMLTPESADDYANIQYSAPKRNT